MISARLGPPRVPPSKYQSNRLRCFSSFGESVRTFLTSVVRTGFLRKASESIRESCGMRIIDMIHERLMGTRWDQPANLRCYNASRFRIPCQERPLSKVNLRSVWECLWAGSARLMSARPIVRHSVG